MENNPMSFLLVFAGFDFVRVMSDLQISSCIRFDALHAEHLIYRLPMSWMIPVRRAACGQSGKAVCWRMCTPIMILFMMEKPGAVKRRQK